MHDQLGDPRCRRCEEHTNQKLKTGTLCRSQVVPRIHDYEQSSERVDRLDTVPCHLMIISLILLVLKDNGNIRE
jgi:hypothetical protein